MNRHVIDVVALHERASATPEGAARAVRAHRAPEGPAPALSLQERGLAATQRWFARAIMTPEGQAEAQGEAEAAARLQGSARLGPEGRLEIYRRAYHGRLVECLADDYPVLQGALGEAGFEALCRAYIERYPSQSPSLNYYGRLMPSFLRGEAPAGPSVAPGFAADLAALEWSIVEVIHERSLDPLSLQGLAQVPAEAWATAHLVPNPALRLQSFDYPVNAFFQAVREGLSPAIPAASPSATVVYRSGPTIWRMDLTAPMFVVLSALVSGENLGDALGRAAEGLGDVDPATVGERVTYWFREWIASGLFVGVQTG